MINKSQHSKVISFFCSRNNNEKTLWQLANLASNCFSYCKLCRLVHVYMVKRLLIRVFQHLRQYHTSIADQLVLANDKNISKIFFAPLITVNLYYDPYSEFLGNFSSCLQVFDNAGYYISITYYNQYGKLVEDLCKNSNLDYNKNNNNIDYKKNVEDEEDDDIAKKKNRRESKFSNDNNLPFDSDPKVFIDVIAQLNLGKIVDLKLLGRLSTNFLCLVNTTPAPINLAHRLTDINPSNVVNTSLLFLTGNSVFLVVDSLGMGNSLLLLAKTLLIPLGSTFTFFSADITLLMPKVLIDILANLFYDLFRVIISTFFSIFISINSVIENNTLAPNMICDQQSLCTFCKLNITYAWLYYHMICESQNKRFLDTIYALSCVKHILLIIFDYNFFLLTSKLYLIDILFEKIQSLIDLIWEH